MLNNPVFTLWISVKINGITNLMKNYYSKRNPSQGENFLLPLAMFVNVF